jgi:hypothetical protein
MTTIEIQRDRGDLAFGGPASGWRDRRGASHRQYRK